MLIIANWKAYIGDRTKAAKLFDVCKRLSRQTRNAIIVAPPAAFLGLFSARNTSRVAFAAQDISATSGGAHTGEIPAAAYAAAGASYALIGHSERRAAGDTNEIVATKLSHALAEGLTPILCVGEEERDFEGHYLATVREELTTALRALTPRERGKVIIAYEPLWAINRSAREAVGTNDLAEMTLYIRKVVAELLPGKSARQAPVLYGGSVEPENVRLLAASSGVDGFLIGHASVDPDTFAALVKALR